MADLLRNSLPALVPRYNGVPRRYEETKPAYVQNFTHKRIVGKINFFICIPVSFLNMVWIFLNV